MGTASNITLAKQRRIHPLVRLVIALTVALAVLPANAADLSILSGGAAKSGLSAMLPVFEAQSGHRAGLGILSPQ